MIQQEYRLDMVPRGRPPVIHVSQYDSESRDLQFRLYGGGLLWEAPTGATVTIDGTKADGKSFSYIATASGSTVTATVTEQMTAAGRAACQITVTKGETVLGSTNFILDVERAALPEDADMSKTDIASVEAAKTQAIAAKEAAEMAQEKAETAQGKAETAESNAASSATAAANSAAKLDTLLYNNAGAHNSIYRGKNLGTSVTSAQYAAISAGTS